MATSKKKPDTENVSIDIVQITRESVTFNLLGQTPIIMEAMSAKAKQILLMGGQKKNAAQKASTLKHDPLTEFRESAYLMDDPREPTALYIPATAFKSAMVEVCGLLPGVVKKHVNQLVWVKGEKVPVYGIPKLRMDVVRSSDMKRTPDVRTRLTIPDWACSITMQFYSPQMKAKSAASLIANAGITMGIGGFRAEKGKGNYGTWECVDKSDPGFARIVTEGGREAQLEALENPACYDIETERMLTDFFDEAANRGFRIRRGA